jgi:periplasmic protein CpxP/Spy
MTYIKNNKAIVFIIGILLLSNLTLLYFFMKKDDHKGGPKPQYKSFREYMIATLKDEVGFNEEQIAQYVELSDKHKKTMRPMFNDIHNAKDSFYKLLKTEPSDSVRNSYLVKIGQKQDSIDLKIFNHFLALKHVCTQEQLPRYDTVIQDVISGMINSPKKGSEKKK